MKKKLIFGIILILIVFGLSGCNEQKNNDQDNVGINYDDMAKFAGVWFNQSGITPEYYLVTEDGKIFVLNKEQGELLKNDYNNFSKIVLNWDSYEKYRFVDGYYELYNVSNEKFFRYATYHFEENNDFFIFNVIDNGEIIYERLDVEK
jgi:hypothetical protein